MRVEAPCFRDWRLRTSAGVVRATFVFLSWLDRAMPAIDAFLPEKLGLPPKKHAGSGDLPQTVERHRPDVLFVNYGAWPEHKKGGRFGFYKESLTELMQLLRSRFVGPLFWLSNIVQLKEADQDYMNIQNQVPACLLWLLFGCCCCFWGLFCWLLLFVFVCFCFFVLTMHSVYHPVSTHVLLH